MKLKNYQEDVVIRAIEIALEGDDELLKDEDFVNDVAAYVLNRVPPRYVMSERGFLRFALEHADDESTDRSLANVIELMMLVNRGVDLVKTRRPRRSSTVGASDWSSREGGSSADDRLLHLVHNFPQFIGRVVDSRTGEPVYDAVVTMTIGGAPMPPAHSGWENPYVTRATTRGHFSFWPKAVTNRHPRLTTHLEFTVERSGFGSFSLPFAVETAGDYRREETMLGAEIVSLQPFLLVRAGSG